MDSSSIPYRFIAIEGNIGAGKTTLSKMLADRIKGKLILEQFADNPFLPHFYKDPERFAFPVELFFMTERHKQLQENLSQLDLFYNHFVADYFFIKTLLFAKNNLLNVEYVLFQRLFKALNATFPKPDILVYLHRPVEVLLENIAKRGREYEQKISSEYLNEVNQAYVNYFKSETKLPILIVNLEDKNFDKDSDFMNEFIHKLSIQYEPGIHHIEFE